MGRRLTNGDFPDIFGARLKELKMSETDRFFCRQRGEEVKFEPDGTGSWRCVEECDQFPPSEEGRVAVFGPVEGRRRSGVISCFPARELQRTET